MITITIIISILVISPVITILLIDIERNPYTKKDAVVSLILNALLIAGLLIHF